MFPTLAAYLHALDPFAIRFPEGLFLAGIRWYGLSYLAGFLVGFWLIRRVARVGISTLEPRHVGDLVVTLAIGIVLGGRLGYVLLYQPGLFAQFTARPPFWGVLAINEGGMASHGGMVGFLLASLWFAHRHGHGLAHVLDLGAFAAPIGLFFGRIANFINGELIGRPCSPGFPLGVKFPQEILQFPFQDQQRIVARLPPEISTRPGDPLLHAIAAVQDGNAQVARVLEPLLRARHPSQLYEALLEGLVLFVVLAAVWARPRRPLVIGSLSCIVYGLVRILGESFRQPDPHIAHQEFAHLGITRGQWLSVLLAVSGGVLLWIFARRPVAPMGGWVKREGTEGRRD